MVNIICFTKNGLTVAKEISQILPAKMQAVTYAAYQNFDPDKNKFALPLTQKLSLWTVNEMKNKNTLIFVGAIGIAVRSIAGGIQDKLTDAPVVVIDEGKNFVIPLLSGHVGGGNQLALLLAKVLCATPVITTATDVEDCFSPDLFAREHNLSIVNREGIKKVSGHSLLNKPVRLCIENYPPKEVDVCVSNDFEVLKTGILGLCPRDYALGIGCRKDTSYKDILDFVTNETKKLNISINQIGAIGSIDLKKEERGIISLSQHLHIPFITYTPELLNKARGEYEDSDFVKEKTGVGNVCERSAMLLTGNQGQIILKKTKCNGITIAIAK